MTCRACSAVTVSGCFATDGGSNICVVSGEMAAQSDDAATTVFGVKSAVLVSGFYAVSGIIRVHARFELGFLRVKAVFDVGGAFTFEMEAGDRRVAVRGRYAERLRA